MTYLALILLDPKQQIKEINKEKCGDLNYGFYMSCLVGVGG